ncbi:MAG: GrpB family protein [Duncaniella sp.]|nr:GrpB family protein [Duncaniella sp.]
MDNLIPENVKKLEDMTLEELWELFPVTLVPHNRDWLVWAKEEIAYLGNILANYSPLISHIGSTAIPGIYAKPIVDILVEVSPETNMLKIKETLKTNGYICMSESERRLSFNKGYTHAGYAEKVFHIHLHLSGDNDELLFKEYLLKHPELAKEYEKMKLSLLPRFRNNRDAYTHSKSPFIQNILRLARMIKGGNC